jgi:hypothetical protein
MLFLLDLVLSLFMKLLLLLRQMKEMEMKKLELIGTPLASCYLLVSYFPSFLSYQHLCYEAVNFLLYDRLL